MNKIQQSKSRLFIVALMLLAVSCCHSSTATLCNCPVYPVGGTNVGKELSSLMYYEYPHLWEWLGRINKLRQELEICNSPVSLKKHP